MLLMDELDYMRLYPAKRKVHIPMNLDNKRKGAAIMLLASNSVDSHTLMNLPYIYNPGLYKSLYIDRNVNAMIDSGAIIDDEPVNEAMQHVTGSKLIKCEFNCITGNRNDEILMRSVYTENRFLKWYRYFKAKEKHIPNHVKIHGYQNLKNLTNDFIKPNLNDKRSGIIMNSYSTPTEIAIICNSAYGPLKSKEGPNWEKYAENELITYVIMNSCKNCSRYLAGQVAAVLCGQFGESQAKKCEDFGEIDDEGLATCYVIYQLYKDEGQRGIVRLCKSGDPSILAAYASKRFIERMKTNLGINESVINEGIIFNSKDITSNISKWGDSSHNILYVCGLSGGGKSTEARKIAQEQDAILIELDIFERAYNFARSDKEYNRYDMNIVRQYWRENHLTKDPQSMNDDEYMKYWYGCWDYIFNDMQSQNKLFVVEGVQIIRLCKDHNPELVNEPFIIKGTSLLTSIERRIKREGIKSALVGSAGGLKGVIGRLNWYFDQEYSLGCLRKAVKSIKQESASFVDDSVDLALKAEILDFVDGLSDKERGDIALNGVYNTEDPNISKTIVRRDHETNKIIGFMDIHTFSKTPDNAFITIAVDPNHRGQGIGRQMVDQLLYSEPIIPNVKRYVWHVDPNNEPSINLAKSCGFTNNGFKRHRDDLDIDEDEYEYIIPFRENSINEGYVYIDKDIESNVDKWGLNGHNILFVCGLSGSGKTMYSLKKAYDIDGQLVSLDKIGGGDRFEDKENDNYNRYDLRIIKKYWKENNPGKTTSEMSDDEFEKYTFDIFKYMLKDMKSHPNEMYIVEGVQLIELSEKFPDILNEPFIIKGSSILKSVTQRAKRDGIARLIDYQKGKINLKNIVNTISYYIGQEKSIQSLRKKLAKNESYRVPLPYRYIAESSAEYAYICNEEYITDGHSIIFFNGMDTDVITEAEKKYDTRLKKFLFAQRLKNNKMVSIRYEEMKAMNPWITKTYLKLPMYRQLNLFIDLSYYHGLFLSNLSYKKDMALNMYWDFINRLMNDKEYKEQYKKITIYLPVWPSAWGVNSVEELIDYTKSINPISLIFRYLRKKPDELKKWGNKDIIFMGQNGYFKVNFSTIALRDISKFKRFITKVFNNEDISEDDTNDGYGPKGDDVSSPAAITASLINDIEKNTDIKIDNITGDNYNNTFRDESLDVLKPTGSQFTHLRIRTGKFSLPNPSASQKAMKTPDSEDSDMTSTSKNSVIFISPSEDKSIEAFISSNITRNMFNKKGFYKP